MKNIILTGMPASGKSTIGIILAKTLGMDFIDTDLIIQNQEKMLLQELIDKFGVEYFLDKEAESIINSTFKNQVVATGGSAVLRNSAMEKLKKDGIIVYIKVPLNVLEKRLSNLKNRGVAMNKNQTIRDVYNQRTPFYEKYADITVEFCDGSIGQNATVLSEKIKSLYSE